MVALLGAAAAAGVVVLLLLPLLWDSGLMLEGAVAAAHRDSRPRRGGAPHHPAHAARAVGELQ